MIKLRLFYIDENNALNFLKEKYDFLPKIIKEKIDNTKDLKTKNERMFAYCYLSDLLIKNGCSIEKQNENFSFSEHGKPYLKKSNLSFSVSHSENVIAIAITENKKIGVDIELINKDKEELVEKILSRFTSNINLENVKKSKNINISCHKDHRCYNFERKDEENELYEKYLKWTYLEALLKCDGGGFCSISKKEDIIKKTETEFFVFEINNKVYAVSVVTET